MSEMTTEEVNVSLFDECKTLKQRIGELEAAARYDRLFINATAGENKRYREALEWIAKGVPLQGEKRIARKALVGDDHD